jgi:multiple sugar transport system permease protein
MKNRRKMLFGVLKVSVIIIFVISSLFPFYFSTLNSFRHIKQTYDLTWVPVGLTLENWQEAFKVGSLVPRWLFNSIFVSITVTTIMLCFDTLAGYAFARGKFRGKNTLFLLIIFFLTVPMAVQIVPIYSMIAKAKLMNTYLALILPAASALGIFMMRQTISSVPISLDEAAKLDGCTDFQILWKVILPLIKPGLASVFLINFVSAWNWFIYPLIVTNKEEMRTMTVALYNLAATTGGALHQPPWGLVMVLITIMFVPVFILFLVFQQYFTKGITTTGFK